MRHEGVAVGAERRPELEGRDVHVTARFGARVGLERGEAGLTPLIEQDAPHIEQVLRLRVARGEEHAVVPARCPVDERA